MYFDIEIDIDSRAYGVIRDAKGSILARTEPEVTIAKAKELRARVVTACYAYNERNRPAPWEGPAVSCAE